MASGALGEVPCQTAMLPALSESSNFDAPIQVGEQLPLRRLRRTPRYQTLKAVCGSLTVVHPA